MIAFVVGPSKAGKSELLRRVLPQLPEVELLDLDAEEERAIGAGLSGGASAGGWEGRWQRSSALLRVAEQRSLEGDLVVDVGAGSLQTPEGRRFFIERGRHSIAVLAPVEVVLRRHGGRDPQEFRRTEYSQEREAVYLAAHHRVDSTVIPDAVEPFRRSVCALLGRSTCDEAPQVKAT